MRLFTSFAAALVLSGAFAGAASADDVAGHMQLAMQMGSESAASPTTAQGPVIKVGSLEISGAWTRAMLPGAKAGGGFLTIVNKGSEPDRLVSVASPAAPKVEIHSMVMEGSVMKMRPVEGGLEIPAGGMVQLKPGSFHIMFLDVEKRFEEGTIIPVTLTFEKAGPVDVTLVVAGPGARQMP